MNYKEYFKDKKVAIIGLGPHGEMIADIKFLLRNKAKISLFDIRSEERLKKYILALPVGGLQKFIFGKINEDELLDFDLIILSTEISKKSTFLKKVNKTNIPIEFPDILFFKLAPPVTFVGIMGLCGKSSVLHLIYAMLKRSFINYEDQGLFILDPNSTGGALNHLKKIKKGSVVLARIPEKLLEYYYEIRMSPHVAVITSPISYKILEFQTYNNFIVAPDNVVDEIKSVENLSSKAKILRTRISSIPKEWDINQKAIHDKENAALAFQTSLLFKVSNDIAKDILKSFLGLRGHLEFIKKVSGIEYYNDGASITSLSTLAAIRHLSNNKNLVLILGGAYTGHNYDELIMNLSQYVSSLILLPGSGTIGLRNKIEKIENLNIFNVLNVEQAVKKAKEISKKGDIVLFSPGFEAIGIDISRKDRGDRFVKAVREL